MRDIILLNDIPYEGAINLPLFEINYLPSTIDLLQYDALIFTSKNAIKAIDTINQEWKNIHSYCIAPKTAQVIQSYQGQNVFTGKKSHGDDFALELIPLLKNKKALYIKAAKTVSKLTSILREANIAVDELTAYETVCTTKAFSAPKENSIIIFTSPSSVECFFKKFSWKKSYQAIVIGQTTAKYLPKTIDFIISPIQSIDSCIKLAQSLQN